MHSSHRLSKNQDLYVLSLKNERCAHLFPPTRFSNIIIIYIYITFCGFKGILFGYFFDCQSNSPPCILQMRRLNGLCDLILLTGKVCEKPEHDTL